MECQPDKEIEEMLDCTPSEVCYDVFARLLDTVPHLDRCVFAFSVLRTPPRKDRNRRQKLVHTVVCYEFPGVRTKILGVPVDLPYHVIGSTMSKTMLNVMSCIFSPKAMDVAKQCFTLMCKALRLTYPNESVRFLSCCPLAKRVNPPKSPKLLFPFTPRYVLYADRDCSYHSDFKSGSVPASIKMESYYHLRSLWLSLMVEPLGDFYDFRLKGDIRYANLQCRVDNSVAIVVDDRGVHALDLRK